MKSLLDSEGVRRVAFTLNKVELVVPVPLELGVLEHLVRASLSLGLVEVVHVQLSDKGRKVAVFEVYR